MAKRFGNSSELIVAVSQLPLVRDYLIGRPLARPGVEDRHRTFTTSDVAWDNPREAQRQLRRVASWARVDRTTLAVFDASVETVCKAATQLALEALTAEAQKDPRQWVVKTDEEAGPYSPPFMRAISYVLVGQEEVGVEYLSRIYVDQMTRTTKLVYGRVLPPSFVHLYDELHPEEAATAKVVEQEERDRLAACRYAERETLKALVPADEARKILVHVSLGDEKMLSGLTPTQAGRAALQRLIDTGTTDLHKQLEWAQVCAAYQAKHPDSHLGPKGEQPPWGWKWAKFVDYLNAEIARVEGWTEAARAALAAS